jgi:hypothetical protein
MLFDVAANCYALASIFALSSAFCASDIPWFVANNCMFFPALFVPTPVRTLAIAALY